MMMMMMIVIIIITTIIPINKAILGLVRSFKIQKPEEVLVVCITTVLKIHVTDTSRKHRFAFHYMTNT